MCSISGVLSFSSKVDKDKAIKMSEVLSHRGPDSKGVFDDLNAVLCHNRLAVIDISLGKQPMSASVNDRQYTIVYNGEIYNCDELRQKLTSLGIKFKTNCDTEVVLYSYIVFGEKCVDLLNGIFAFCIYEKNKKRAFLARDPFGVKPLYYYIDNDTLLFASEVKGILAHPDVKSEIDDEGLYQLIYMTPVTTNGSGVFKSVKELCAGQCGYFDKEGLKIKTYWSLSANEHHLSREQTVEHTRQLLFNSVKSQLVSDVPLCTFLSGGLDSSVVSAMAKSEKDDLCTYSFEYEGNKQSFESSLFQPQRDDEFAQLCADFLHTNHTVLTAPTKVVADNLVNATIARDLPGQADIDSSLLYFCSQIRKKHTVALSGECADEIFGGYPWFYREEMLSRDFFPWIHQPEIRASLFKDSFIDKKKGYEYAKDIYVQCRNACPTLESDSKSMKTSRIASYLSQKFFMQNLLERKDRMSMYSSLEVRVPFADKKLVQFVFDVPWEIKFENEVEKALLRNAAVGLLPDQILYRKKSPYPKTHNKQYYELVLDMLNQSLNDNQSFLNKVINKEVLSDMLKNENATWFGQLMALPQLIAWLIQMDVFFTAYKIKIV